MSILPFIDFSAVAAAAEKKELPLFREYAYDFENNCLLKKDGKTYLIEGNEALKIWIYKALYTQRYRYTAHSRSIWQRIGAADWQDAAQRYCIVGVAAVYHGGTYGKSVYYGSRQLQLCARWQQSDRTFWLYHSVR